MTQRNIEIVIGRLLTDEEFRERFVAGPEQLLRDLLERGTDLSHSEIFALVSIDSDLWRRLADEIDPRLQKVRLKWPFAERPPMPDGDRT